MGYNNISPESRKGVTALLDNFIYSAEVIIPIFILVALGILLRKLGVVEEAFSKSADKLVFKVGLPSMLFLEVAGSELTASLDPKLVIFSFLSITGAFLGVSVVISVFVKDNGRRGAMIQGICRSNFAILGVPLLQNMFGDEGVAAVALVLPVTIFLFNTYSVIVLSVYAPAEKKLTIGQAVKKIVLNIVTNPLIISVVLGLLFTLLHIPLYPVYDKTLNYLKAFVTPIALISLGSTFRPQDFKGRIGQAITAGLTKTILLPAIMVTLAVLWGFRGVSLGIILILFGAPTAVSSYVMAKNMGSDGELAGQILLFTTLICLFTIFLGIFILRTLAFI